MNSSHEIYFKLSIMKNLSRILLSWALNYTCHLINYALSSCKIWFNFTKLSILFMKIEVHMVQICHFHFWMLKKKIWPNVLQLFFAHKYVADCNALTTLGPSLYYVSKRTGWVWKMIIFDDVQHCIHAVIVVGSEKVQKYADLIWGWSLSICSEFFF